MANFGALSSLGLGSGVLNYDVIDKLKKADENIIVKPIENQYKMTQQKEKDLANITMVTSALKTAVLDLANGTFYAKRAASVNGDDVKVTVQDGVDPQQIAMTVEQLAQRDVWESKGFSSETASVVDRDTTMTMTIDGSDYSLDVKAGTTLEELREMINETTEGRITASILDAGGDDPMHLILKSDETGADQAIGVTFDDGDSNTSDDDFLSLDNVQSAQNAIFKYNGVTVERAANKFDDLIPGVTFELLKADPNAVDTVNITQDVEGIADTMQNFVDTYNKWISAMNDATKFDEEKGTAGIFQGNSTIRELKNDVAQTLFAVTPEGKGLASFGISVNKDGMISLDRTAFIQALETDGKTLEKTFSDDVNGVFTKLNDLLAQATDPINGTLTLLDNQFKDEEKRLEEERTTAMKRIDAKYSVMAQRFALYDEMIGKMNNNFMALQSMIDAQTAAAKK